jgi:hypothetical protein
VPLAAAEPDSPARLPEEVERYFFSSYRPPQSAVGVPGHFVPVAVPEEVLERVIASYREDSSMAADLAKLVAEVASREAYEKNPSSYHPWTYDEICGACVAARSGRWGWRGVQAVKGLRDPKLYSLTCGMLKDAGAIESAEDCAREDTAATKTYVRYMEKLAKSRAKGELTNMIVFSALVTAMSAGIGAAAGIAAGTAAVGFAVASAASTAMSVGAAYAKDPKSFNARQGIEALAQAAASLIPIVGEVGVAIKLCVDAALTALRFEEYLKSRGEITDAIEAQQDRVDALTARLRDLIQARATLDEIVSETARIKAELDAIMAERESAAPSPVGKVALAAAIVLGAALLAGGR